MGNFEEHIIITSKSIEETKFILNEKIQLDYSKQFNKPYFGDDLGNNLYQIMRTPIIKNPDLVKIDYMEFNTQLEVFDNEIILKFKTKREDLFIVYLFISFVSIFLGFLNPFETNFFVYPSLAVFICFSIHYVSKLGRQEIIEDFCKYFALN